MAKEAPPAAPPAAKKTEKKQLTEVQKLKLFNVHLNQRISQLESEKLTQMQTIVALQKQVQESKAAATNSNAAAVYKELGIAQGDEIELSNDGTLLINPPPPGAKPPPQELFSKKNAKRANGERRGPQPMAQ